MTIHVALLRSAMLALPITALTLSNPLPAAGQIPDTFTNLQVLPEDIPRSELIGVMRGFAGALGVRCNHCHVGEDPQDFTGYDFASDEKEVKRVARAMMRMRERINGELIPATGREDALEVQCVTCHRGISRPVTLQAELLETLRADGVDAAVDRYRELRDEYYGRAAYDFGQGPINSVTERLLGENDSAAALAIIRLNIEHLPDEPYPYFLQARALLALEDRNGAIASLERAVELAPETDFFRTQLERLRRLPPP